MKTRVGRRAIRLMDLADPQTLPHKIDRLLAHHNALRRGLNLPEIDGADILKELTAIAPKVLPFADSVWNLLDHKRREGKRILFEGAQGALLDVDHGTYPYVTSSNTVAAPGRDRHRHGPEFGRLCAWHLQGLHHTRWTGTVPHRADQRDRRTDRPARQGVRRQHRRKRRCGWFDAVLVRQTARTSGIHGLALTKLDILDGFDEIQVCVGYKLDGKEIDHLPAGEGAQARVEPIYETIEGWKEPTANAGRGRICPRRPSNMFAGSRNWSAARLRCFPPARNARILSSCKTHSRHKHGPEKGVPVFGSGHA